MSDEPKLSYVLIAPRMFQRPMSEGDVQAVEDLVQQFNQRMVGQPLVCAAQALGILTADYCEQIKDHGGDTVYALQDIAGRGENWIHAGAAAREVVEKAKQRVVVRRRKAGKVR